MFCSNCGKQLLDRDKFCKYCGAATDYVESVGQQDINPQAEPLQHGQQDLRQPPQFTYQNPQPTQGMGSQSGNIAETIIQTGYKTAKTAGKAKFYGIISTAVVAIALMIYFIFLKPGTPEDTITKMEKAFNKMDIKKMVECFDSQSQDLFYGYLNLGGDLAGVDLNSLAQISSGFGGIFADAGVTPKISMNVTDVEYFGSDECTVSVDIMVNYKGEIETESEEFPMTKEGRDWLISISAFN